MPYKAVTVTPSVLATHPTILPSIARLHASCILIDGTLATFIPPLNASILTSWWEARWAEAQRGERVIFIVLADVSDPSIDHLLANTPDSAINALPSLVVGVVSLATPFSQTGPFRSLVEKFFVSPSHRRLGLGRKLMAKLEETALAKGRTNILLDTTVGTPAESVYPALGYRQSAVIQRYGIHPLTGELVDEVWFWKDLNFDPVLSMPED